MSDPMTDERFNQILIHAHKAHRLSEFKWFCQFVREADRARMSEASLRAELAAKEAECERLTMAMTGIASDVCWMDCREQHPREWKSQPRERPEAHDENCPKRIAHDALNPEATE